MSDYNGKIIAEFRSNGGHVQHFGSSLVILHTVGAKTGQPRVNPIMAIHQDDGSWLIAASAAGALRHPAWYHNLLQTPDATIETGTRTVEVSATVLDGPDHAAAWALFTSRSTGFADYQERAGDRRIPVVKLTAR